MKKLPALLLTSLLLTAACDQINQPALQQQSQALISNYGAQADKVRADLDGLLARLRALPTSDKASGLLARVKADQDELAKAKGQLGAFPATFDGVLIRARQDLVDEALAGLSGIGRRIAAVGTDATALAAEVSALEAEARAAAAAQKAAVYEKKLTSGYSLSGNLHGIEAQLVGFIEDAGRPVDKTTWFNFDRLRFKTGSAAVEMETSREQLANIAEILKAYPAVKLKIGGYTDNQGKAELNKKLSSDRASAVMAEIVKLGAQPGRLEAEGYGAEFPECPANDTEECRAQNRRIAIRVLAK